jgi:hypothetical protein
MNGVAIFGDEWALSRTCFCGAQLSAVQRSGTRANDDERDGSIRNCSLRYIAGQLPLDDAGADPPCQSETIARRLFAGWQQLCRRRRRRKSSLVRRPSFCVRSFGRFARLRRGAIAEEEAAAIAGEAATGAVEAIKLRIPDRKRRQEASLCLMAAGVFRFILVCIRHQFGIT